MHNHSNPVIRLDGDRAAATWYVLTPVIDKQTNKPHWIAATYEDEYVRVERSWKFRKICAKVIFSAPYDTGWVEKREQ
jgi:hypothetical protein